MTQVTFYLIQNEQPQADLACRLCRKIALTEQIPLLVKFSQQGHMEQFDAQLWQFEAASFVPHDIDDIRSPICLSLNVPEKFNGCCINLGENAVSLPGASRIIEIIENNEAAKQLGRERFKTYRDQGIEPNTFKV
jgi:DNA polymerase-3 subunit chi